VICQAERHPSALATMPATAKQALAAPQQASAAAAAAHAYFYIDLLVLYLSMSQQARGCGAV
jgi:hypothetical protein